MENFEGLELSNVQKVLEDYCKTVTTKYKDKLIKDDKIATGRLLNSVNTNIKYSGAVINVVLNLEDYFKYVEFGRKPGKFPPISAIETWIEEKHIMPNADKNGKLPTTKQLSFLIGRSIANNGIAPGNQLHDTLEECNNIYLERLKQALQVDFDVFSIRILTEIEKSLKKWC